MIPASNRIRFNCILNDSRVALRALNLSDAALHGELTLAATKRAGAEIGLGIRSLLNKNVHGTNLSK